MGRKRKIKIYVLFSFYSIASSILNFEKISLTISIRWTFVLFYFIFFSFFPCIRFLSPSCICIPNGTVEKFVLLILLHFNSYPVRQPSVPCRLWSFFLHRHQIQLVVIFSGWVNKLKYFIHLVNIYYIQYTNIWLP